MPSLRIIRCSIQPVPSTTLSTGLPAEYVMSVADMSLSLTVLARECRHAAMAYQPAEPAPPSSAPAIAPPAASTARLDMALVLIR